MGEQNGGEAGGQAGQPELGSRADLLAKLNAAYELARARCQHESMCRIVQTMWDVTREPAQSMSSSFSYTGYTGDGSQDDGA